MLKNNRIAAEKPEKSRQLEKPPVLAEIKPREDELSGDDAGHAPQ